MIHRMQKGLCIQIITVKNNPTVKTKKNMSSIESQKEFLIVKTRVTSWHTIHCHSRNVKILCTVQPYKNNIYVCTICAACRQVIDTQSADNDNVMKTYLKTSATDRNSGKKNPSTTGGRSSSNKFRKQYKLMAIKMQKIVHLLYNMFTLRQCQYLGR